MKDTILFYRYNSVCEPAVISGLENSGFLIREIWNNEPFTGEYRNQLGSIIKSSGCSAVFSVNFFPHVSELCNIIHMPYISITVDCPVMELYSDALAYPCNYNFLFDQSQFEQFYPVNPGHIFYMPLAADVEGYQRVIKSYQGSDFTSDISFVGSLYSEKSPYDQAMNRLPESIRGYLDGVMDAQKQVYGMNFLDETITPEVLEAYQSCAPYYHFPEKSRPDHVRALTDLVLSYRIAELERTEMLNALAEKYSVDLYTASDASSLRNVHVHGAVKTLTEMPLVFNRSRINLNFTMKAIRTGIPQRVWDVMACGGFLLTNYQQELGEYFVPGEDLETFGSTEELMDKAGYYLSHEDVRKKVARQGYEKVASYHDWDSRMKVLFDALKTGSEDTGRSSDGSDREKSTLPSCTVCIITRDESEKLDRCLKSLDHRFPEVVVLDTGSADSTPQVIEKWSEIGSYRLISGNYSWNDDFSAARNYAATMAGNDIIFAMDTDEYLKSVDDDTFVSALNSISGNDHTLGSVDLDNLQADGSVTRSSVTRLYDRKKARFRYPVHEQIEFLDESSERNIVSTGLLSDHDGYAVSEDKLSQKADRNIALLKKALSEGDDPYLLYQLGKALYLKKDYSAAAEAFDKALYFDLDPKLEYVQDMVETYGYALLNSGQADKAIGLTGLEDTFGGTADFRFLLGLIYMQNGQFEPAVDSFLKAAEFDTSKVKGACSYLAWYNAGVIMECLNQYDEARILYGQCKDQYEPALERYRALAPADSKETLLHMQDSFYQDEVIDGFYVPTMMKRCWASQFEVLRRIERVCKNHGLRYFIMYGTLIGAVRHKSIIPWDDDIDIGMMREDYDTFMKYAHEELPDEYNFHNVFESDSCENLFGRINCSLELAVNIKSLKSRHYFPYVGGIDIFPIDYLPDSEKSREDLRKLWTAQESLAALVDDPDEDQNEVKEQARNLEKITGLKIDWKRPLDNELRRMEEKTYITYLDDKKNCSEVACFCLYNLYGHKYNKKWFSNIIMLEVNGQEFPAPADYDDVLKVVFGDYHKVVRGSAAHNYPYYKELEDKYREAVGGLLSEYIYNHGELVRKELRVEKNSDAPTRILFLGIRYKDWDSLKGVYQLFMNDPDVEVTLTCPYYHYTYTDNGEDIPMDDSAEFRRAGYSVVDSLTALDRYYDAIITNIPYDSCNMAMHVNPGYYSDRLQEYTDHLIYIPWFIMDDFGPDEGTFMTMAHYYIQNPVLVRSSRIFLQSETMKERYVESLTEMAGEDTRKLWEDKITPSGSPLKDPDGSVCRLIHDEIRKEAVNAGLL